MSTATLDSASIKAERGLRASAVNERRRLVADLDELTERHEYANGKAAFDQQWSKRAFGLAEQIATARARIAAFDTTQAELRKLENSTAAKDAKKAFNKAVSSFEDSLARLVVSTTELRSAAEEYSAATGVRDASLFPHRQHVLSMVTLRTHAALDRAGVHFEKYAPANRIESLAERWGAE